MKEDNKEIVVKDETKKEEIITDNVTIHQMPKKYKSGSFSYSQYSDKALNKDPKAPVKPSAKNNTSPSKKHGLIIMVVGIILLAALAFGAYWYLKNKDFSLFVKKVEVPSAPAIVHQETPVDQNVFIPTSTSPIIDDLTLDTPDGLEPITKTIVSGVVDSDSDGLNDGEELILGLDPNNVDTDGDSYSDFTELINLYNPNGDKGDIYSMTSIKKYQNSVNKYFLAYPAKFSPEVIDNGASIIFKADDESFIQVIVQDHEGGDSIGVWYEKEFLQIADAKQLFSFADFSGVRSTDGLTLYFTNTEKNKLYIISYTPLDPSMSTYINIMEVMLKSFTVTK